MTKRFSLFLIPVLLFLKLNAQQQWKFHVAFEEATGQKDTLWLLWDSTANAILPVDTVLGEEAVSLDYSKFNIWIYNANLDTTKTMAYPFGVISFNTMVRAFNYQYPLNIYWDTSLFSRQFGGQYPIIGEARIDNDYFWSVNNDNLLQAYNMLLDNHAYAPAFNWFSQSQFPMNFQITRNYFNVTESINFELNLLSPNPTNSISKFQCKEKINEGYITDIMGNVQSANIKIEGEKAEINISDLPSNVYFLTILTKQNHRYHSKIIKLD